jgi:hypothetical protein
MDKFDPELVIAIHFAEKRPGLPKIPCPMCGMELTVCNGPDRCPYLAHRNGGKKCPFVMRLQGETQEHSDAKFGILAFCLFGGCIIIKIDCTVCGCIDEHEFPMHAADYKTEFLHAIGDGKYVRWDFAALDEDGNVLGGLEIKQTHQTDDDNRRGGVYWSELRADSVNNALARHKKGDPLRLDDVRRYRQCRDHDKCAANKARLEEEERQEELKRQAEEEAAEERARKKHEKDVEIHTARLAAAARMRDIAIKYYFFSPETGDWWDTYRAKAIRPGRDPDWGDYEGKGCCIRCAADCEKAAFNKPYCWPCYERVGYENILRSKNRPVPIYNPPGLDPPPTFPPPTPEPPLPNAIVNCTKKRKVNPSE